MTEQEIQAVKTRVYEIWDKEGKNSCRMARAAMTSLIAQAPMRPEPSDAEIAGLNKYLAMIVTKAFTLGFNSGAGLVYHEYDNKPRIITGAN